MGTHCDASLATDKALAETPTCAHNCHGNGLCTNGQCVCNSGFAPPLCESAACPSDCGGPSRGTCVRGVCFCHPSASGWDCGDDACPAGCHGNGMCEQGRCACTHGFYGRSCAEADPLVPVRTARAAPRAIAHAFRADDPDAEDAMTAGARRLASRCSVRCAAGCAEASCPRGASRDGCYAACVLECVPECLETASVEPDGGR